VGVWLGVAVSVGVLLGVGVSVGVAVDVGVSDGVGEGVSVRIETAKATALVGVAVDRPPNDASVGRESVAGAPWVKPA
jgi:hypothetical protein